MVARYALYFLIAYVCLCLVVFIFQRRLLYLPSKHALEVHRQSRGLTMWPEASAAYLGFAGGTTGIEAKGTVLVFHGNAGSAVDRSYYADALGPLGYRVILAEYPGYGARSGKPSEKTLVSQAQLMIDQIKATYSGPLYLWGESLGAGVAAAAARTQGERIDGVVLLTPWYALPDLAQAIYRFLPARLLVLDRFESAKNLANYRGSVAVLLAERDEIIPPHHGQRLYDSLETRKRRWVFAGAGHNSWPVAVGTPWWSEVMTFLEAKSDLRDTP